MAGIAGSVPLKVPAKGTRPTSDKVREAVFSALDARGLVDGAHVLDLYAGSGALGLEAASRGAASVVLVDVSKAAAKVAEHNARTVANTGAERALVMTQSADAFLAHTARRFDLVFLDPPYDVDSDAVAATLATLTSCLSPSATVVLERAKRDPVPALPSDLTVTRTTTYGDTAIHWLEHDR